MEKEIINRREAIKRMMLLTGSLVLGPSLLGFGSELLGKDIENLTENDIFFIRRIGEVLNSETSLFENEKNGTKKQFRIYSIVHPGHPAQKGLLQLERGESDLTVDVIRKGTFGHHQYIRIEQNVSGRLCEPAAWDYTSRFATQENTEPLYGKAIRGKGEKTGNSLSIRENDTRQRIDMQTDTCTLTWNLFEAIEELAAANEGLEFDTIDEYDIYGGVKKLRPFKSAEIDISGKIHYLRGWLLTGTATLPLFFWLDRSGHLLFANSGMVVYVREP